MIYGEFRFSCINIIIIITGELVKLERTRAPANTTTAGQRPEPEYLCLVSQILAHTNIKNNPTTAYLVGSEVIVFELRGLYST